MPRALPIVALLAALALALTACGRDDGDSALSGQTPQGGAQGSEAEAAQELGFPTYATKNTTRVGGADPVADAAATALAAFPGGTREGRPAAVTLVDVDDWRAGIAASALVGGRVRAPVLFAQDGDIPDATQEALEALAPTGSRVAGNAQVIRIGDVPAPEGYRTTDVTGRNPFDLARAIDALLTAANDSPSDRVVIASADQAPFAMPAAGWAAKSGDPVLFVREGEVPRETIAALRTHQQPRIYVLGPSEVISPDVTRTLRRLGTVVRTGGENPIANAIEFARFNDGRFGWGVVDPGHGLVFANAGRPADAAAAAPLASTGKYGPLLLLDRADRLPAALREYLLDVQPGFDEDPVRGVYNHGWILGDEDAISAALQAQIDALLEIAPVNEAAPPPAEEEEEPPQDAPPQDDTTPQDETTPQDQPTPQDGTT